LSIVVSAYSLWPYTTQTNCHGRHRMDSRRGQSSTVRTSGFGYALAPRIVYVVFDPTYRIVCSS
jgi:hypothetical protein